MKRETEKLIEKVSFEKRPDGIKGEYNKYKVLFLLFVLFKCHDINVEISSYKCALKKSFLSLNLDIFRKICIFLFFKSSAQVLVLAPTRELANQVAKDFKDITRKLSVACFYGGTSYQSQSE